MTEATARNSYAAEPEQFPMRLGAPAHFARVREFFRTAGFDEAGVCAALGVERISDIDKTDWDAIRLDVLPPALHWAIALFVRCVPVREQDSRNVCGEETFAAFLALGLCRPAKSDASIIVSTVWIYPADGFVLVSDRRDDPDGEEYVPAPDVVFPASYHGTLRFLQLLPDAPDGEALDIGGGSGIGAMHMARTARNAVTSDITERAAYFAAFNAQLNAAAVECVCGDMYAPVAGRRFDLIACHPPWVPTVGNAMVFRDGGDTGEEITRRVVEGLPTHLKPGGTCIILCMARDTEAGKFEDNARAWLGQSGAEFDIVFGLERTLSIEDVVKSLRKRLDQQGGESAAADLHKRLESLGTKQFVYGPLFVRRSATPVTQPPTRIRTTQRATAADFERVLAWRAFCRTARAGEWLPRATPRLSPQLELTTRQVIQDGRFVPVEHLFSIENAFEAVLQPDAFIIPALVRLNGQRSVAEVFRDGERAGEFPQGFPLEAFVGLIRMMAEQGFLLIDPPH